MPARLLIQMSQFCKLYSNYKSYLDSLDNGQMHNHEDDFHISHGPRIQHWGKGLRSRINALPPETMTDYAGHTRKGSKPVVSHEIGQWCVYPNFDEIKKYTGVLKARNFEIFKDLLKL